jgi:putative colanic acid biosynthesis glycosyltransferase WcaI
MRVLILSQYYKPEPVPKPAELAEALCENGHTVSVVTGFPNYPSGNLYAGFKLSAVKRELIDGVPVIRSFEFPYHGQRAIGRILNYVSFMLSAPLGALLAPACDVIYVWHPPLTIGIAAWLIARWRGAPFVYDVQDIWPEIAVLSGLLRPNSRTVRLLSWLERFVYQQADHLLVVANGARDNLIAKGVPPSKVTVMPHWVDESLFEQTDPRAREKIRAQYSWDERFVVLFAGNIGLLQGLETVVSAAAQLPPRGNILIVLVGDGTDKARLQQRCADAGLHDRLQFIERQPMERMPAFMAAADVLLVHLKRSEIARYVIPTKTLAYLAAGQPILMAMEGAAADLVQSTGAGIVVAPEDPVALATSIKSLWSMPPAERRQMGAQGKKYLNSNLSKEAVVIQYEALLKRVASRAAG